MILFKQMLILFFLMLLGYGMARKGIIDKKVSKSISWLIVNIANPALILSGSQGNTIEKKELLFTLMLAVGMFVILIVAAELVIPLFRFEKKDAGVYKVMLVFSNMGFMGFPIIAAMYGTKALLYASVFLLPFNILIYTYGIFCMSEQKMGIRETVMKFLNIGLLAGILSLLLAVAQITLPDIVGQTIDLLSNLTAPLCMMVIGASFVEISFQELFCDRKLLLFSGMKLILIPLAGMFLIRLVTDDAMLSGVSFIVLAAPAGSMAAMLAQQYDGNYLTASRGIALTTLLSVITMPLLFAVMGLK